MTTLSTLFRVKKTMWISSYSLTLFLTFLTYIFSCPIPFNIQSKCRCAITETGRVYIYCARKQLIEVPHFNNSNIIFDELVLSGNRISIVHKNAFNGLKLRKLELQANPLVRLESNAFVDLANYLEELILSTTIISSSSSQLTSHILIQILSELPNLKRLSVRSFDLSKSWNNTDGIVSRKLTQLSLQACSMVEIVDVEIFVSLFPNIERLDFSENRFEHFNIPLVIALKKLKILILSKNKIRHLNIQPLPSNLIPSNSLIELDLSYNGIETIDEHIFELFSSQLESLNLRNNELATEKHLTFLIHLYHLREFYLDYNRLESINQLYLPVNLKILSLKYNRLHRIDLSILIKLIQLEKLALSYNQLSAWTSSSNGMSTFPSLETLELDRNQLSTLSTFVAPKLKQINLDGNRLGNTIDQKTFAHLPVLERLQLRDNQIEQIDAHAFVHTRLQTLDLRNNSLSTMPLFATLNETLQVLSLRRNRLCTIDGRSLAFYRALVTLELEQNPLHCDCRMGNSVGQWIRTRTKAIMSGQCESPPERRNINLIDLSNEQLPCSMLTTPQCTYLTRTMIENEEDTTTKKESTTITTTVMPILEAIVNERQQPSSGTILTTTDDPTSMLIRIADLTVTPVPEKSHLLVQWQLFPSLLNDDINNDEQHRLALKRHGLNGFKISSNSPVYKLSELLDVTQRNYTLIDVQSGEICLILLRTISYEKHCKQIEPMMIAVSATTQTLKSSLIIDAKQSPSSWYMNEPTKSILIGSLFGILFVLILITFVILLLTRCPHVLICRLRSSKYHQSNDAKSETLLVRPTPTNTIPWPSHQHQPQQHLYHHHPHPHRPVSYQPSLSTQCTCPTHYHSSGSSSSTGGSGSHNGQNYHIYQEILNDDFHPQTLLRQQQMNPCSHYHTQHRTCRPLAIETSSPQASSSSTNTTTTSNSEQCQLCSLSVLV